MLLHFVINANVDNKKKNYQVQYILLEKKAMLESQRNGIMA